jgi:rod shape-determining protein MreD
MAYLAIVLIMAAATLLGATLVPYLAVDGVKPDLGLLLATSFALLYGPRAGFIAGLAAGVWQDLLFGRMLGMFGLAKALTGYLAGWLTGRVYRDNPLVVVGAFLAVSATHDLLCCVALAAMGKRLPGIGALRVAAIAMAYNGLIGLIALNWTYRLQLFERIRRLQARGFRRRRPGVARV